MYFIFHLIVFTLFCWSFIFQFCFFGSSFSFILRGLILTQYDVLLIFLQNFKDMYACQFNSHPQSLSLLSLYCIPSTAALFSFSCCSVRCCDPHYIAVQVLDHCCSILSFYFIICYFILMLQCQPQLLGAQRDLN